MEVPGAVAPGSGSNGGSGGGGTHNQTNGGSTTQANSGGGIGYGGTTTPTAGALNTGGGGGNYSGNGNGAGGGSGIVIVRYPITAYVEADHPTTQVEYLLSKEDADNTLTCSLNAIDITSTKTIPDLNWHQVGCLIDRDGVGQIYLDGKPDGASVAISSTAMATTANLTLGTRSYSPTNYFSGQLDDVEIYNYLLTPVQIQSQFNGGAVNFSR